MMLRVFFATIGVFALAVAVQVLATRERRDLRQYGTFGALVFHALAVAALGVLLVAAAVRAIPLEALIFPFVGLGVSDFVIGTFARRRSRS